MHTPHLHEEGTYVSTIKDRRAGGGRRPGPPRYRRDGLGNRYIDLPGYGEVLLGARGWIAIEQPKKEDGLRFTLTQYVRLHLKNGTVWTPSLYGPIVLPAQYEILRY